MSSTWLCEQGFYVLIEMKTKLNQGCWHSYQRGAWNEVETSFFTTAWQTSAI